MHAITIKNGTRVREMFYSDFKEMLYEHYYMCDEFTYDLLSMFNMKTVVYNTYYEAEDSPDMYCDYVDFMDNVQMQIDYDGIAIVLQHCEENPDIVFVIASDN